MGNGNRYTKQGPFGDTFLYDDDGNLLGRGFSDSHGTTRFTGANGEYIGRSDPGLFGGTNLFDAEGQHLASGVDGIAQRKGDMKTFLGNPSGRGQESLIFDEDFYGDDDAEYDTDDEYFDGDDDCVLDIERLRALIPRRKTAAAQKKTAFPLKRVAVPQEKTPAAPKPQPAAPKAQPAAPKPQPAAPKPQPAAPKAQPAAPKAKAAADASPNLEIVGETLVKYRGSAQIIVLPDGIRRIAPHAFEERYNLEAVVFSEGLLEISRNAFFACRNLVSVVLPESLLYLRDSCLYETGLRSIRIPGNVVTIEKWALPMDTLERITVSPQNPFYKTIETSPGLFSKDGKIMYGIPCNFEDIYNDDEVIPEGVEVFDSGLFAMCPDALYTVTFPQSLRKIGSKVFMNWSAEYDTVCLPPNVEEIDAMAFGFLRIRNLYIPRKANVSPDVFPKSDAEKYPTVIHRYDKPEPWMKFELTTPWNRNF